MANPIVLSPRFEHQQFCCQIHSQIVIADHKKEISLISKGFEQLSQQNCWGKCGGACTRLSPSHFRVWSAPGAINQSCNYGRAKGLFLNNKMRFLTALGRNIYAQMRICAQATWTDRQQLSYDPSSTAGKKIFQKSKPVCGTSGSWENSVTYLIRFTFVFSIFINIAILRSNKMIQHINLTAPLLGRVFDPAQNRKGRFHKTKIYLPSKESVWFYFQNNRLKG